MKKLLYFPHLLTLCIILLAGTARAQVPVISSNPVNDTVCSGHLAWFSVGTSDTTVTYMWQVSADLGATWDTVMNGGIYSGASTDTLHVFATDTLNGRWYRAYAMNDSGTSLASGHAKVLVNPLPVAGPVMGSSTVCYIPGNTVFLIDSSTIGHWASSDTSIGSVDQSGFVTENAIGWVTISYTVTTGCGTSTSTHLLTIQGHLPASLVYGPTEVCVGSHINLNDTVSGGTWSVSNASGSISPMGVFSGMMAGIDTVTYTYTNSCGTHIATHIVTTETPFSSGMITGSTHMICNGSWTTLTATPPGGWWMSSNTSVATVDASGNVTGRGTGTAIVSYIFSNSCGSAVAVDTMWVSNPASAIAGMDSVGVGNMITLMDTATGGFWYTTDTLVAHVDSTTGTMTGLVAGTAQITYVVTNSCGTSHSVLAVMVGDAPDAGAIVGPDTLCNGAMAAYSSTIMGGTWSVMNANASINDTGLVTGNVGGTYDTVLYTVHNAFGTTTSSKLVWINRPPVVTVTGAPTTWVQTTLYILIASPAGGVWHTSASDTVGHFVSANSYIMTRQGRDTLIYTVSNACGTTRDTLFPYVPIDVTSVATLSNSSFSQSIYPNPSTGAFSLTITSANIELAHVTITDVTGKAVKNLDVMTNKTSNVEFDQAAGLYIVTTTIGKEKMVSKLTINR